MIDGGRNRCRLVVKVVVIMVVIVVIGSNVLELKIKL